MDATTVLVLILAMAAVTEVSRLPLLAARRRLELPPLVRAILEQVPVAAFAVIAFPAVLAPEGDVQLAAGNLRIYAAAASLVAAVLTRSLFLTIVLGIGVLIGLELPT